MRVLIISILIYLGLTGTIFANQLLYIVIDSELPLKKRNVVSEFISEISSSNFFDEPTTTYTHIIGLKLHYPKFKLFDLSKRSRRSALRDIFSGIASRKNYLLDLKSKRPERVEITTPSSVLGSISKNLIAIMKDKPEIDKVTIIQFSNFDFDLPKKTDDFILGDGWITAKVGPLYEFVSGSQSRALKNVNVFIALDNPVDMPLTWFSGRTEFFQKLYSSVGANITGIKRIGAMPYGGGAVLSESFKNSIIDNYQILPPIIPKDTNLIQIFDPNTLQAETLQ